MDERLANGGGFLAIVFWSTGTLLFSMTYGMPALLNTALVSLIAFIVLSFGWIAKRENPLPYFYTKPVVLLWCMFGLGANTICHIYAVRMIPPVEATLVNYTWPMMCVILACFLRSEKNFKIEYFIGAVVGFVGIYLVVRKPGGLELDLSVGHFIMFIGAFSWAFYSVGTRILKNYPSEYLKAAFLGNAVLFFALHAIFEHRRFLEFVPSDLFYMCILGTLSGIAYLLWDKAMKYGHMQILNVSSNAMPVLSTIFLIIFGKAVFSLSVVGAALLIVSGTLIASKDRVKAVIHRYSAILKRRPIDPLN